MNKIIIAIDGFSSCGKSTMAKDLAKEIGYIYIAEQCIGLLLFTVSSTDFSWRMEASMKIS